MYYGTVTTSGGWVKVPHTPVNTDKCVSCSHVFSEHFETYDGSKTGCNSHNLESCNYNHNSSSCRCPKRKERCSCDGFAMRYRDKWEWKTTYNQPVYYPAAPSWQPVWNHNTTLIKQDSTNVKLSSAAAADTVNPGNTLRTGIPQDGVPFKDGEILKYRKDR